MHAVCDLGNTRLKWGCGAVVDDRIRWQASGALDYGSLGRVPDLLRDAGVAGEVLMASVAGAERESALGAVLASAGLSMRRFASSAFCAGVHNDYADPTQLGVDRWSALVAAWHHIRGPALVVNAGTATTIDLLDLVAAAPHFRGGAILPGLGLMTASLASGTARLPAARGTLAEYPRSTDDAIATGILHAQLGAIERLRRQLPASAPCLLTGGNAPALLPHLAARVTFRETLVLDGLLVVASS